MIVTFVILVERNNRVMHSDNCITDCIDALKGVYRLLLIRKKNQNFLGSESSKRVRWVGLVVYLR
jgi:hypothetical protein